jgi:hypothetical protein
LRNRIFILAFVAFLCVVLAGYGYILKTGRSFSRIQFGLGAIAPAGAPGYIERAMPTTALRSWADGDPQASIKGFMRNQFLGFDRVLLGYSGVVTQANDRFFALYPHGGALLIPIGVDTGNVFRLAGTNQLIEVLLGNAKTLERVPSEVQDANALAQQFPGVNFTYYGVSEWTMTKPAIDAGYRDPVATAWQQFSDGVSSTATVGRFNADDWQKLFFATDHHWNPVGQYQGYLEIMQLLSRKNPKIGTARIPFAEKVMTNVRFQGSIARTAAYSQISEPFRALTGHDPKLHAYLNGKRADYLIMNKAFLKNPPTAPFASLYPLYNGTDYPIIEYRKDAPGAGNLLIFADSFSNSMEDLVASHYQHTYSVDLRHYGPETGKPFDIATFIKEHQITDVLIMGRPARVMTVPTALKTGEPVL